jgi:hypothetical protein
MERTNNTGLNARIEAQLSKPPERGCSSRIQVRLPLPPVQQPKPIRAATRLHFSFLQQFLSAVESLFAAGTRDPITSLKAAFSAAEQTTREISGLMNELGVEGEFSLARLVETTTKEESDPQVLIDQIGHQIDQIKTYKRRISSIKRRLEVAMHAVEAWGSLDPRVKKLQAKLHVYEWSLDAMILLHHEARESTTTTRACLEDRLIDFVSRHDKGALGASSLTRFMQAEMNYVYARYLAGHADPRAELEVKRLLHETRNVLVSAFSSERIKAIRPGSTFERLVKAANIILTQQSLPIQREAGQFDRLLEHMSQASLRSPDPKVIANGLWREYGAEYGEYVAATYLLRRKPTDDARDHSERLAAFKKVVTTYCTHEVEGADGTKEKRFDISKSKELFALILASEILKSGATRAELDATMKRVINSLSTQILLPNGDREQLLLFPNLWKEVEEQERLSTKNPKVLSDYPRVASPIAAAIAIDEYAQEVVGETRKQSETYPAAVTAGLIQLDTAKFRDRLLQEGLTEVEVSQALQKVRPVLERARAEIKSFAWTLEEIKEAARVPLQPLPNGPVLPPLTAPQNDRGNLLPRLRQQLSNQPREAAAVMAAVAIDGYVTQEVEAALPTNPFAVNGALLYIDDRRIEAALRTLGLTEWEITITQGYLATRLSEARAILDARRTTPVVEEADMDLIMAQGLREHINNENNFRQPLVTVTLLKPLIETVSQELAVKATFTDIGRESFLSQLQHDLRAIQELCESTADLQRLTAANRKCDADRLFDLQKALLEAVNRMDPSQADGLFDALKKITLEGMDAAVEKAKAEENGVKRVGALLRLNGTFWKEVKASNRDKLEALRSALSDYADHRILGEAIRVAGEAALTDGEKLRLFLQAVAREVMVDYTFSLIRCTQNFEAGKRRFHPNLTKFYSQYDAKEKLQREIEKHGEDSPLRKQLPETWTMWRQDPTLILSAPMQRTMRWKMTLGQVVEATPADHPAKELLQQVYRFAARMADLANEMVPPDA